VSPESVSACVTGSLAAEPKTPVTACVITIYISGCMAMDSEHAGGAKLHAIARHPPAIVGLIHQPCRSPAADLGGTVHVCDSHVRVERDAAVSVPSPVNLPLQQIGVEENLGPGQTRW
jgi:hypothetical protein